MPIFPREETLLSLGECRDIGISQTATAFNICRADGSSLSTSNYGSVGIPSTTAGLVKTLNVTANATISHGDTNELGDNSWGITTTVNWAEDRPLYLYAINFGNSKVYWGLSDDPTKTETPATVYYKNVGGANVQGNFLCMTDSGGDDLAAKPCVCVGAIRIQWTT